MCGEDWVKKYLTDVTYVPNALRARAGWSGSAGSSPSSGQASQHVLVADFNGDGNLDSVSLQPAGTVVNLMAADGSVLSTNTFQVGFRPTPDNSQIIAADFNGDGNLDLAISYSPDTNAAVPGTVVILPGNGDGTFGAPTSFPAGLNPLSLAAADFNGDGKMDIAVANVAVGFSLKTVSLLLGNSDGTFGAPTPYPTGEDVYGVPSSILALDLNGDGAPDLVVANNFAPSISVLLNSGGKLGQPTTTSIPFGPSYLAYGDFNNDGNLDLVVACQQSNALVVLQGNGDGTFQPSASYAVGNYPGSVGVLPLEDGYTELFTADGITGDVSIVVVSPQGVVGAPPYNFVGGGGFPTAIAAADLNGDGQPDVVIVSEGSAWFQVASIDVSVLISQGGTQFRAPVSYSLGPSPTNPQAVAIGDLNGDGSPDVIVANNGGSLSVLLGNGDGTLRAPTSTPVNQFAQSLALGDFNGDGKLDVAVAAYGYQPGEGSDPGGVAVLLGKGDGTFQPPLTLTVSGLHPVAVAAADLNGDGKLDLAVVMTGAPGQPATLAIFFGQGNWAFASPQTIALMAAGGTQGGVAIGDLNGDGKPDIAIVSSFGQQVDILLGDGAGGFQEAATTPTTDFGAGALVMTDLNGDGELDLVIPHCCGLSDATFLLGNGDGTFQAEQHFLSGSSPTGIALTRFSGSNGPDLVIANQGGTWISLVNAFPTQ